MSSRGRSRNPNENPGVKPVERIELSEKNPKKRIVAAVLLLAIGLGFLGYALFTGLSREEGWTQIEPVQASGESVSGELVLFYDLGASGKATNVEYKEVSTLYTDITARAYRIFNAQYGYDEFINPYYINRHVGEEITVEPVLYKAFETLEKAGSRALFAAAYYREYRNLFSDTEDASAALLDPYKNEETAAYFAELSRFTSSEEHVSLELLGNNTVKLHVSQEYQTFARENAVESFIDFYWMRNAFVIDWIAEEMTAGGFGYGSVSSYDGFMRVFDGRDTAYSYHLYGAYGEHTYDAARLDYQGKNSIVCLRAFPVSDRDDTYYQYKTGERRHPYVDPADGLCKNATPSLVSYAYDKSCAQVLVEMLPVYMTESLDSSALTALAAGKTYSIYFDGNRVVYNDPQAAIRDLYQDTNVSFKAEKAQ